MIMPTPVYHILTLAAIVTTIMIMMARPSFSFSNNNKYNNCMDVTTRFRERISIAAESIMSPAIVNPLLSSGARRDASSLSIFGGVSKTNFNYPLQSNYNHCKTLCRLQLMPSSSTDENSNEDDINENSNNLSDENTIGLNNNGNNNKENKERDEKKALHFSTLRSLGVDFGLVRTGIAITTGGYRPQPVSILSNLNNTQLASTIVHYVKSEQATQIVLGLPLHKNGTSSEQSDITRVFGQVLLQEVRKKCGRGVKVILWDERYTSKEAASRIVADAMARNQRIPSASDLEGQMDADAACIILEHYYYDLGLDAEEMVFGVEGLEEECEKIYSEHLEREERERKEAMDLREKGRNARREMIERAKALEEEQGVVSVGGGKKKKKKKKKK